MCDSTGKFGESREIDWSVIVDKLDLTWVSDHEGIGRLTTQHLLAARKIDS
jgi:hypothetical protein